MYARASLCERHNERPSRCVRCPSIGLDGNHRNHPGSLAYAWLACWDNLGSVMQMVNARVAIARRAGLEAAARAYDAGLNTPVIK